MIVVFLLFFIMPPLNTDKRKEQIRLACLVEQKGFEMPLYSLYECTNRKCIISPSDSLQYSEYICSSKKCNIQGLFESDWESLF